MIKATFAASMAAGAIALGLGFQAKPANAASMTGDTLTAILGGSDNRGSDDISVQIDVEDIGNDLKVTLQVLAEPVTNNIADLRGFFFDVSDESILSFLSVSELSGNGAEDTSFISGFETDANELTEVGDKSNRVNINGGGSKSDSPGFDAGFVIGTSGKGKDDVRSLMFALSAVDDDTVIDLGLDLLRGQRAGIRATSTGPEGSAREGSSKLVGEVPTPALLPSFVGMGVAALRKRKKGELTAEEA